MSTALAALVRIEGRTASGCGDTLWSDPGGSTDSQRLRREASGSKELYLSQERIMELHSQSEEIASLHIVYLHAQRHRRGFPPGALFPTHVGPDMLDRTYSAGRK